MQETGRPRTFHYQVMPGETLEMVMSKFWSETNHDGEISWSLKFGGIRPLNQKISISSGVNTIDCISATQERLQPKVNRVNNFKVVFVIISIKRNISL